METCSFRPDGLLAIPIRHIHPIHPFSVGEVLALLFEFSLLMGELSQTILS